LLGLGLTGLQARENIYTTGGNSSGSGGSVSYSVGQLTCQTHVPSGKPNVQVGAVIILPELLPLRLNCPWQTTAATAMVRSTVWIPSAAMDQVPWMIPTRSACSSSTALPA